MSVNFTTDGSATYTVTVDGEHHSTLAYDLAKTDSFPPYDSCTADGEEMADVNGVRSLPVSAVLVECDLTGMTPNSGSRCRRDGGFRPCLRSESEHERW